MSWDLEKKYWRTITETNQTENKKNHIREIKFTESSRCILKSYIKNLRMSRKYGWITLYVYM